MCWLAGILAVIILVVYAYHKYREAVEILEDHWPFY
jgi:hypothetical protein